MSVIEKYNWATIKISKVQLGELFKPQQGEKYSDLANKIPRKAEPAEKNRTIKELAWAKATKKANKPSIFAKILGGLLVVAGIIIAAIPIPVVTQALGGGVAALGIGIVTGVVGLGLVSSDIRGSKSAAKKQYRKELAKLELADTPDKPNDQEDKLSASTEEQTTPQPDAATTENCGSGNSYQPLFEKTQAAPSKGTLDPNKEGSGIKPSNHCKKTLKEIRADSTSPERPDTEPKSGSKSPGM